MTAAPQSTSYTHLLQAIQARTIQSATVDDDRHLASITYRDGRTASVLYPASDATLAQRMVNQRIDVRIASGHGSSPLVFLLPLLVLFLASAAVVVATR